MSRHWANIGEAGALSGLRFMAWVYRRLGRTAFNVILVPVMFYYVLRRPIARRASREYLLRVKDRFPDALPGRVTMFTTYLHFFRFGQSLLDKFVAWIEPPTDIAMDERQREQLYALVDSGRGCLMIGSHFGNLEYSRGIAHRHPDLVINVLIHDKHAQNFAALLSGAAPQSRLNLIQVTDLDLDLALRLKQKVDAGEWLLIAGDRVPVGEGDNVCEASFLGHAARFPVGPYVLASLLKCPVYLLHCFNLHGEYRLEIEKFADEIRPSRINQRRSWTAEAQRFSDALERQVGKAPLQWFNFFDFWDQGRSSAAQGDAELRHSAKI